MLGHSVSYYLPKYWATTPLYAEKIIPLLDHMLSVGSPDADKLATAYYDIWNKYTSPEEMSDESIKEYIRDHGYGYIVDLLLLSGDTLQNLLFLLPLIAILKDTKEGLKVVLSLLSSSGLQPNITAWYETLPVGEEDTFIIDSTIDLSSVDSSFFKKFDVFIQKYVYPTLSGLKVAYSVSGKHTLLPVIATIYKVQLNGVMDI